MAYDEYKYRGHTIKIMHGAGTWRAVVYDPFKQGPVWDHFAISGYSSLYDTRQRCHKYVDQTIEKEMEKFYEKWQSADLDHLME